MVAPEVQPEPPQGAVGVPALERNDAAVQGRARRWQRTTEFAADWATRVAVFLVIVAVLAAAVGPYLLETVAIRQHLDRSLLPPLSLEYGWEYLLGSNILGQSILGRLVFGARTTLFISVTSVIIASVVGTALGAVAGYFRGPLESLMMRFADIVLSFPSLLMAVIVLYLLGPGIANLVLVLGITRMPVFLRVARAGALETRTDLHVEAARALGLPTRAILTRHIVPAVMPTIATLATLGVGLAMLLASALTFLGIGLQPPAVSWGLMVSEGRNYLESAWWISLFPGLAILTMTMAFNVISNRLRKMQGGGSSIALEAS